MEDGGCFMRWMSAAAAVHRGVIIGKNEPLLIQPGPFLPEFFFMNILSSNCSDCKNAIYLKFGGLINWLIMAKIWKIMANRYSEHKMIISYWAGGQLGNRLAIGAVLVWFPTRRYTVQSGIEKWGFRIAAISRFRCHVGRQSLRERGSTRIRKVHSFI